MPEIVENIIFVRTPEISEDRKIAMFREILEHESLKHSNLLLHIRTKLGNGSELFPLKRGRKEINNALEKDWIIRIGRYRSPTARYSLNI